MIFNDPCNKTICENGGTCIVDEDIGPHCNCTNDCSGPSCSVCGDCIKFGSFCENNSICYLCPTNDDLCGMFGPGNETNVHAGCNCTSTGFDGLLCDTAVTTLLFDLTTTSTG